MVEAGIDELTAKVRAGDRTALGRAVTVVESTRPEDRRTAGRRRQRLHPPLARRGASTLSALAPSARPHPHQPSALPGPAHDPPTRRVAITAPHRQETMTMRKHKSARIMSVLAVLILSTACSTAQDSADGQESAEPAPFTYEYPEFLLINRNDRSTPLGKLCWAFFEYASNVLIRSYGIVAEHPNFEVTFPTISDATLNGESNEPSIGSEDYFIDSLNEILEPSIAGVVNDIGLSEELQLFAKAFFAYIEAEEREARAVGWANIDRARLPYQDFEDLPHMKEFEETLTANPDKCAFPSEDEWNPFLDEQEAELEEYLEEYYERNRQSVNIE